MYCFKYALSTISGMFKAVFPHLFFKLATFYDRIVIYASNSTRKNKINILNFVKLKNFVKQFSVCVCVCVCVCMYIYIYIYIYIHTQKSCPVGWVCRIH